MMLLSDGDVFNYCGGYDCSVVTVVTKILVTTLDIIVNRNDEAGCCDSGVVRNGGNDDSSSCFMIRVPTVACA
jgi:hypothetical protein